MVYPILISMLKRHFYVIHTEKLSNATGTQVVERLVVKHPKLKPELIVINDQPYGFKALDPHTQTLEKFPIYVELELSIDEQGEELIESVDLYAESPFSCRHCLSDVIYLANQYSQTVSLDRVRRVNEPSQETMLIYSMMDQLFGDEYIEDDIELGQTNPDEVTSLIESYLIDFVTFISELNRVVTGGLPVSDTQTLVGPKGHDVH